MVTCPRCGGTVRKVWGGYGFIGNASMLYHWLTVTEAKEPVQIAANAWMCDACRMAGGIPPPLTPLEKADNERRWAEIEAHCGDTPFWRSTVPEPLRGDPASPGAGRDVE